MLNLILGPNSKIYCKYKLNDHCKDFKSYLEYLKAWKYSKDDKKCTVNTVDVANSYGFIEEDLLESVLEETLTVCTNHETSQIYKLYKIAKHNNIIQFRESYFKQK